MYFCNVKTYQRLEIAGLIQLFLWPTLLVNYCIKCKVCGSSNTRKVSADEYLTAPCAYIFLCLKLISYE